MGEESNIQCRINNHLVRGLTLVLPPWFFPCFICPNFASLLTDSSSPCSAPLIKLYTDTLIAKTIKYFMLKTKHSDLLKLLRNFTDLCFASLARPIIRLLLLFPSAFIFHHFFFRFRFHFILTQYFRAPSSALLFLQ